MSDKSSTNVAPVSENTSYSQRFTNKVLAEFKYNAGSLEVTEFQRQLIQGYFICIDKALKTAEENRIRRNADNTDHKYDKLLPVTWDNVNLPQLSMDIIAYARMGLDMTRPNHLFPIPYENKKTQKYDVNLMLGYNGIQYTAEKYALDKPVAVNIELVYSTDDFRPIKKSIKNNVESYEFDIKSPFKRGEVVGGFGYIQFENPLKNKLVMMSLGDILKRKPEYASAEFWGGTKKAWKDKKKVDVETDGWFSEMCLKTVKREIYSEKYIPRDPRKIDEAYQHMKLQELKMAQMQISDEITINANSQEIDVTASYVTTQATDCNDETNGHTQINIMHESDQSMHQASETSFESQLAF